VGEVRERVKSHLAKTKRREALASAGAGALKKGAGSAMKEREKIRVKEALKAGDW